MVTQFLEDVGGAVGRGICTYLGGVGNAERWLQRQWGFPSGGFGAGIRGALCDDPTPPPPPPPPFQGGQCPGILYDIEVVDDTFGQRFLGSPRRGALGSVVNRDVGTPENPQWEGVFTIDSGGNTQRIYSGASSNQNGRIVQAIRVDGLPDDCGDPDPDPPPEFEPVDIPETVPNPTGGPDIPITITINAPIVIGPNVFAPVTIGGPEFQLTGQIDISPEFNIRIGGGPNGRGGGGSGTGVEPIPTDIEPDSPSNPPEADGRRIIGLIVTLSVSDDVRATELAQDGDIGSIGVPRIAIAYLISNNGGVRVALSGVDLKLRNTYIPVPPSVEVVSWRIHTEPGVSVANARPVYGTTQAPS